MAQKITIENFGPIQYFEGEVKDLMIFIGPQASGKSTIAKLVYFFRSLRDEYISIIIQTYYDSINTHAIQWNVEAQLISETNILLHRLFPSIEKDDDYKISFYYSDFFIKIKKSEKIKIELGAIPIEPVIPLFTETNHINPSIQQNLLISLATRIANNLFEDNFEHIFIPAGRSTISALANKLIGLDFKNDIDFLSYDFIRRITNLKPFFKKSFDEIVADAEKNERLNVDKEIIETLQIKINKILRGKYLFNTIGEKIYFNKKNYILLQNASSGQQESLWILLQIFNNIINQKKSFIVFEEPEAHLYPIAQKNMVDLMGLMLNNVESQLIITTHSPYILSAFNNLLLAKKVLKQGGKLPEELEELNYTAIDVKNIAAYFVENGECRSIIDEEFEQINAEEIDAASTEINDTFYKLFDLDEE